MVPEQTMTIGEVASRTGLGIGMIRYYEKMGLLTPLKRQVRGYRLFAEVHVQELIFIQEMKRLGFKVGEIKRLKALGGEPGLEAGEARRELLRNRLAIVEKEIARLQSIKRELLRQIDKH